MDCEGLIELVLDDQGSSYRLNQVVFIIGLFRMVFFRIGICEPLYGPVR